MYQFFVEPGQIQGRRIIITGSDVNHIRNVLRMKPGEEIAVSNGTDGREYRCGIESFTAVPQGGRDCVSLQDPSFSGTALVAQNGVDRAEGGGAGRV